MGSNKRDVKIVKRYLNAKVGTENGLERVLGRCGINENGEMFIDFCASQELTIGGT
jgi:hypothetical protein